MSTLDDKLKELDLQPMPLGGDFVPFSTEEIAAIEQAVRHRLPDDYRRFLATYGASLFDDVWFPTEGGGLYFGSFFSAEELLEAYRDHEEVLPESVIPIADDGGGNLFCIEVADPNPGSIYFHNHGIGWHADADKLVERGEPVPADIRYQTVYKLASSFTKFILGMTRGQPD